MRVANLVLGVVALVGASDLDMFGEHRVPGPGFLPILLAGALLLLGLLLAALTLLRWRARRAGLPPAGTWHRRRADRASRPSARTAGSHRVRSPGSTR